MGFENLHQILRDLYTEMMPLCESMANVAKALAGFGALFYIAYRVWKSLAKAEPIDVYPLLRPFALGICIMFFPYLVLGTINTVMSPIVKGTNQILENQTLDMKDFAKQKDELEYQVMLRNPATAYLVSNEEFDKRLDELGWGLSDMWVMAGMYMDLAAYKAKKWIRDKFRDLLELVFHAVALCIDTVRTFFLIVLSILGPIAFAFAVFDGFHNTLAGWLMRYISVYLWLPVADLFSAILMKIQTMIIQRDMELLNSDPAALIDSSNAVYIIFMIIGILGYFTIPTVAGWIIQTGGVGNYGKHVNDAGIKTGSFLGGFAGASMGNAEGTVMGRNGNRNENNNAGGSADSSRSNSEESVRGQNGNRRE